MMKEKEREIIKVKERKAQIDFSASEHGRRERNFFVHVA